MEHLYKYYVFGSFIANEGQKSEFSQSGKGVSIIKTVVG